MQKEKSIYADVLESAISWRVRDMYNLYGTIRRVLFEGRKAERAAMLSELIKMQGGNIGGSANAVVQKSVLAIICADDVQRADG